MQVQAWLQAREVLLLVDLGSSSSLVDARVADKLQGQAELSKPCNIKVAYGGIIQCRRYIPNCSWFTQGHKLCTDFKIITLGSYDAILGMDWLRKHSSMHVNWETQPLSVTTLTVQVELQAIPIDRHQCSTILASLLKCYKQGSVAYLVHLSTLSEDGTTDTTIPPSILHVLEQFTKVFEEPNTLPPWRACEHRIPLMEGTQPFNLRQYGHKLELKNEIE